MASDIISGLFSWWSSDESASYQKYMAKLKQQQVELDKGQNYNSALDTLLQLGSTYQDIGLQIKGLESDISTAQYYIDNRYQGQYDLEMAQAQLNIDKYSSYLESYGQNRSLAMNNMFYGNIGALRQMQEGLAQQQVLTAARGQGGATAKLLSQMQMQEIVNFAGADQTLDAEGGIYGQQYQAQRTGFETEYSQNKAAYDIAVMEKNELQQDLETQYQNILNQIDIEKQAKDAMLTTQQAYYSSFQDALAATIKAGHYAGETYTDLGEMVDRYRDYLDVSDEQYAELKANLLNEWKPLDFEIRQDWYTYDLSEENSHIKDYNTNIYDKATGQLATQEQIEKLLMNYAGNIKQKDLYKQYAGDKYKSGQGLSDKAIEAIIKNSNYNTRKDYK